MLLLLLSGFIHHSSFIIHNSSLSIHRSSFIIHSSASLFLAVVVVTSCALEPVEPMRDRAVAIGRRGVGPGSFSFPRAVVPASDGTIVVIDRTGRIQQLGADGSCLATWTLPEFANGTPTSATFDRNGNLLVADTHYSRILRFSADGTSRTQFGHYGKGPGEMIYPQDVASDANGFIYVANYGGRDKIIKLRSDGTFVKEWGSSGEGPGQFNRPMALALLGDKELLVADACNHRVQRFDLEGRLLGTIGKVGRAEGQLNYPYDIAASANGEIYVCEYGNCRISKFARDGRFIAALGGPGAALAKFRCPWGVALDRAGYLYVADTENHRIVRFVPGTI